MRYVKRPKARPVIYAIFYPCLVKVANKHGYALALHGSMRRDCDIIAIPWTDDACSALTLLKALAKRVAGAIQEDKNGFIRGDKPHGRVAYCISIGSGAYLDISFMPRKVNS